jgi:CubicO group peptidase (beta-lactamase class C family)/imidazolonepropionase-like amidohydrolase
LTSFKFRTARSAPFGLAAFAALSFPGPAVAQGSLAFTHVTVIDGADSTPRRDQTVIIRGNRIVTVAPSRSARVPAGARVVAGRGKFLIPGLWDMHVHTSVVGGREVLPLYVANGVTGVRDMAGEWATVTALRDDIAQGRVVGPRIIASGPYLEGGDVPIPHILARTPDEARAGVDSLVKLGVDFVKVHSQLKPETYFAIARRARERGIPFAGHVPRVVGSASASDSGQRSIEHLLAIPAPCTPAESIALQPRFTVQGALGRCSSQDLAELYARFVRNDTWVTPTFVAQYEVATWPRRTVPGDSLARYLPHALRRYVAEIPMPDSIPPGADSVGVAMFAKRLEQVATMHRAGVRILTGTDAPLRNSPPGFGLHEELLLLARGGLSPFEIIRAATLEPARYFGMLDSAGTIAPGQLADLVLLDANPLRDIRNTRRIAAVVANGRLYDAKDRARLLRSGMQPADLAARIARIETGLLFPVVIRGRPPMRMRLDQRMRDLKVPGVSIAVIDSFRIAWARGYGVRETGGTDPVTTETLFQAASMSKPIAALAALRMVQEGVLNLDEDVNRKLKSWKVPENRFTTTQPVTLRRLLSHSAGLTVHGFRGYAATEQLPTLVQMLDSQPPSNSAPIRADTFPGARWRYSGGGYTVMQQLLIDVSGRPFPELMRARVLDPLGMTHSTYEQPLPKRLLGGAASGHRSDGTVVKGKWHTYPEMAAAGLWTTPSDIARYAIHVSLSAAGRSNGVLSRAAAGQMLTVQSGTYGLGPSLGGQGRDASFSHGGANEGFRGFFIAFPERGQGAVIMTNSDAGGALASEILRAIAEECDWPSQRPVEKTVATVSPEAPTRIAGRFALETTPNIFITITADSGRVLAEVTDQFKTEIYPESETQYFSVDRDVEFTFGPEEEGKVMSLVARVRSGGTFKAKRVE